MSLISHTHNRDVTVVIGFLSGLIVLRDDICRPALKLTGHQTTINGSIATWKTYLPILNQPIIVAW